MQRRGLLRYSLLALSVLLGVVIRFANFDSSEIQYVAWLQQAALSANIMWFFQVYSHFGDSIVWISVALLLFAYYYKVPRKPLKFAAFITVITVVVIVMRLLFPRDRPYLHTQVQDFAYEGLPSYPSGHIAPTAGGLYLLANHSRNLNFLFGALVVLLGISRVATGTHFFTDIIGAALFSYPIAAIIDDMKLFERFKDN